MVRPLDKCLYKILKKSNHRNLTDNTDVDALYIAVPVSFHVRKECVVRKIRRVHRVVQHMLTTKS